MADKGGTVYSPFEGYSVEDVLKFLDSEGSLLSESHRGCIGCEVCTRVAMFDIVSDADAWSEVIEPKTLSETWERGVDDAYRYLLNFVHTDEDGFEGTIDQNVLLRRPRNPYKED